MEIDMYIEDFREIVVRLKDSIECREKYLDNLRKVDVSLVESVFENKYVDSALQENDFLVGKLFGDLSDDVFWFLYDHKPGFEVIVNEVKYVVTDIDSYVDYIEQVYKLPMKPKNTGTCEEE
jgi:hypothetical protein